MFNLDTLETHLCFNLYAHTAYVPCHSPFGVFVFSLKKHFYFEVKREFKLALDYLIDNQIRFEVVYE